MRTAYVLTVFLAAGSMLAQSPAHAKMTNACPVGFMANVSGRAIAHTVNDAGKGGGQLLEISFDRLQTADIVSATVAVHGAASGNRVLPVKNETADADNNVQIFKLDKSPKERGLSQYEVWVTKLSTVAWSEVTELRYADGSIWQASKESQCMARPSLFKLVDATAQ